MKVHFIVHESFEAPAAIETWAKKKGCAVGFTKLYADQTFPASCEFDLLVVMGGPQSPATTMAECPHFDGQKEIAFIKKAVDEKKVVLGVCLGAQMIGEAHGARFEHSPNREIGVYPITLTEDGKKDAFFGTFPETFDVGHWHGDMPGLTPESKILATSEGCPRQIVKYSPTVYGFQCHFEFTPEAIEGMIDASAQELEQHKNLPYVQTPQQLRLNDYSEMNAKLFQFLDHVTSQIKQAAVAN
jgi:GMP synthase (glutamine-hydrolysing)